MYKTFNSFNERFNNPFLKGKERIIIDKIYSIFKEKLDNGEMDYDCVKVRRRITGDAALYPSWGGDGTAIDSISLITYKNNKRIELKYKGNSYIISVNRMEEDVQPEEDDIIKDGVDVTINHYSYKIERLIRVMCRKKERYTKKRKIEQEKKYRESKQKDIMGMFDDLNQ